MKSFLQAYFYYTRAERNGAFVLALLCAGLVLLPRVYPHIINEPGNGQDAYEEEALAFFAEIQAANDATEKPAPRLFHFDPNTISKDSLLLLGLSLKTANSIIKYRDKGGRFYRPESLSKMYTLTPEQYQRLAPYIQLSSSSPPVRQVNRKLVPEAPVLQPFPFDPNTATEEELIRLGLPERLSRNIIKYRAKGGRFRQPDALRKIYGMNEEMYLALEPFIAIAKAEQPSTVVHETEPAKERSDGYQPTPPRITIDINQANEEEWQKLYGIGPAYARRITRFRDKLGGFSSISQVGETYGLPDSTFQQIRHQLQASPVVRRLNINTADAETLKAHPYLDWRKANAIVNYRAQHGPFKDVESLRKVRALPAEVVGQMEPYLAY